MRAYTHPQPDPLRLMRYYRQFLVARKRLWMGRGAGHRCLRAHMKYLVYVDQYLAAKALCFRVATDIHNFFIYGDSKPGDPAPVGIVASQSSRRSGK
jgi:hypothetical protein